MRRYEKMQKILIDVCIYIIIFILLSLRDVIKLDKDKESCPAIYILRCAYSSKLLRVSVVPMGSLTAFFF